VLGRFRSPETAALHFLIIADCLSHTAVHRRQSDLSCCRCSYLKQSASTRHLRTLCVCFPRTPEGFPLKAFLALNPLPDFCSACAVNVVVFGQLNRSFYLLIYFGECLILMTHNQETSTRNFHNKQPTSQSSLFCHMPEGFLSVSLLDCSKKLRTDFDGYF